MNGYSLLEKIDLLENTDMSFEQIKRINPSLDDTNPMTYSIFLEKNPRLTVEQREYFLKIKKRLEDLENERYEKLNQEILRRKMCNNIIDEKKDEAEKIKTEEETANDSTSVTDTKRKSHCALS